MHPIATMCRVLGVSPGGFYARLKRPPSARAPTDAELSDRMAEIHRHSRATYGAPRIHAELRAQGIRVGRKRVARLLREAGLHGASRRKWVTTTVRDRNARPAPDLVNRNFTAAAPTVCGSPISLTFQRGLAFCISQWCSTRLAARSWAGRWRRLCGSSWC